MAAMLDRACLPQMLTRWRTASRGPGPIVPKRARRRTFSAKYNLGILAVGDAEPRLSQRGQHPGVASPPTPTM